MRDRPKYDSAQLSLALYNKWGEVLNDSTGKIKFRGSELSRDKTKVKVAFEGIEYIMGFRESNEKNAVQDFFVYFPNYGTDLIELSREAIKTTREKFNHSEKGIYQKIFGREEAEVSVGNINYEKQEYNGILSVASPVFEIPLGKNERLSDNLFIYFRRGILGPVHTLIGSRKTI